MEYGSALSAPPSRQLQLVFGVVIVQGVAVSAASDPTLITPTVTAAPTHLNGSKGLGDPALR